MTAGPDGVRGSKPHQRVALKAPKALRAHSIPGPPGRAITSLSPSQLVRLSGGGDYAASVTGERKFSSFIISAQAIRAILLAKAMITTLGGRRS